MELGKWLEQTSLLVICNEGVFYIMLNTYLDLLEKFTSLIPMLGRFHRAKWVEHCIEKYLKSILIFCFDIHRNKWFDEDYTTQSL